MDLGDLVELGFWAVIVVLGLGQRLRALLANRQRASTSTPSPTPRRAPRTPGAEARRSLSDLLAAVARRQQQLATLDSDLPELLAALRAAGPHLGLLEQVGREHLAPRISQARAALDAHARALVEAPPRQAAVLARDPALHQAVAAADHVLRQAQALRELAEQRRDPAIATPLADAEALAQDLWAPLEQFARVQGLDLPHQRVICVPGTGREALVLGLLPGEHPVLVVPDDFGQDLYRHAALAHELGHLVWARLPGFAADATAATGLDAGDGVLRWTATGVKGTLALPASHWLPELVADAFAVLLLGPAGLLGLCHSFQRPDAPEAVLHAHLLPTGRRYDEHPPAHLRVHLAAHLLARMGFDQEAAPVLAAWDAAHGHPDAVFFPVMPDRLLPLPAERVVAFLAPRIEALYTAELPSLSGFSLEAVPGLALSPGLWARARERAAQLVAGQAFHDDGRTVLVAAILARQQVPGAAERVRAGVRQALVAEAVGERRPADRHYTRPQRRGATPLRQAVVDALLLRAALAPPRRVWPPGPGTRGSGKALR